MPSFMPIENVGTFVPVGYSCVRMLPAGIPSCRHAELDRAMIAAAPFCCARAIAPSCGRRVPPRAGHRHC